MTDTPQGWSKQNNKLLLVVACKDFTHALALLNSIADIAESLGHHPDLALKNYNQVSVASTTHSSNGLTEKDYALATKINDLLHYQSTKLHIQKHGRD